ncbi:hypothetical protein BKA70DRAFT_835333 [Coprinopsis sp. MPI-PUGE-AT-0042]|nr:hypothetical protein BKA70DRAFT_835333 [Coprinopsis sp. MPI-PUGE-AT-0042]
MTDQSHSSGTTRFAIAAAPPAHAKNSAPGGKLVKRDQGSFVRERKRTFPPRKPLGVSSESLGNPSLSAEFVIAQNNLRFINKLVIPHGDQDGILKRVAPLLVDLERMISFASTAYNACRGGTTIGRVIRTNIEARMALCNRALEELHGQIERLAYRSFPQVQYAYRVVYEWWTTTEPEEISDIRKSVSNEVTAIGEWLRCLHSFWWASSQLLKTDANFTMKNLSDFLTSGQVTMLRMVDVEEIVFLEPLQGERRSIPVRFVRTFEDVHMAVAMACHKTEASRFIASGSYELDDPTTDTTIDKGDFLNHIAKCKEYEVTIFLSNLEVPPNQCPRCGHLHIDSNHPRPNGWQRCRRCKTKFNGRVPEVPLAAREGESDKLLASTLVNILRRDNRSDEIATLERPQSLYFPSKDEDEDEDEDDDEEEFGNGPDAMQTAKLFRRIKFDIKITPSELERFILKGSQLRS